MRVRATRARAPRHYVRHPPPQRWSCVISSISYNLCNARVTTRVRNRRCDSSTSRCCERRVERQRARGTQFRRRICLRLDRRDIIFVRISLPFLPVPRVSSLFLTRQLAFETFYHSIIISFYYCYYYIILLLLLLL